MQSAVSAGLVGWPEDIIRVGREVRDNAATVLLQDLGTSPEEVVKAPAAGVR